MDFALDEEFSTILYFPLESLAFSGSVILNVARSAQQQLGGAYVMIMRRPAGDMLPDPMQDSGAAPSAFCSTVTKVGLGIPAGPDWPSGGPGGFPMAWPVKWPAGLRYIYIFLCLVNATLA